MIEAVNRGLGKCGARQMLPLYDRALKSIMDRSVYLHAVFRVFDAGEMSIRIGSLHLMLQVALAFEAAAILQTPVPRLSNLDIISHVSRSIHHMYIFSFIA